MVRYFFILLVLGILSIVFIDTYIKANKLWIFIYIQGLILLQVALTEIAMYILGGYMNLAFS